MNSRVEASGQHRLPVYIAVDTSASMFGQAAEAFKQGVKYLLGALKAEEFAGDIYVSQLFFSVHAARYGSLVPLKQFVFSNPEMGGASRLKPLLELLSQCLEDDLNPSSPSGRGDYKALIFIFTDGCFSDQRDMPAKLLDQIRERCARLVLIGCGARADYTALKRFSPDIVRIDTYQPGELEEHIDLRWL